MEILVLTCLSNINGFNLDKRQTLYYLYENDLRHGKISGRLDFESYDKDSAVRRTETVAFIDEDFKKLADIKVDGDNGGLDLKNKSTNINNTLCRGFYWA